MLKYISKSWVTLHLAVTPLNKFELDILKITSQNPGINKRSLMKKVKIGTRTFYKNFDKLVQEGHLTFDEIGNEQKCYVKSSDVPDFLKTKREIEFEVKRIKRTIKKNLKLLPDLDDKTVSKILQMSFIPLFSFNETLELLEILCEIRKIPLPKYISKAKHDIKKFIEEIADQLSPSRYEMLINTFLGRYHGFMHESEILGKLRSRKEIMKKLDF